MKIKNVSATNLLISDLLINGYALELAVDEERIISDKDAEQSASLKALIDGGSIDVTDETAEPVELGHGEHYANYNAVMTALAACITDLDARVTALENPS